MGERGVGKEGKGEYGREKKKKGVPRVCQELPLLLS